MFFSARVSAGAAGTWFLAALFVPLLEAQYPTTPITTQVGTLYCGLRLLAPNQVQSYCYLNCASAGLTADQQTFCAARTDKTSIYAIVHNSMASIPSGSASVPVFVMGNDQILWLVSNNLPPGSGLRWQSAADQTARSGVFAVLQAPGIQLPQLADACFLSRAGSPWAWGWSPYEVVVYTARTGICPTSGSN